MDTAGLKRTATSAPARHLFADVFWICSICGKSRPNAAISGMFHDAGSRIGVRPGIVGMNIRYCNDNPACAAGVKNYKLEGRR